MEFLTLIADSFEQYIFREMPKYIREMAPWQQHDFFS